VKLGVQFGLFGGSIYFLGGDAQRRRYLPDVASLALPGCFAMTELGHGSNVRDLQTIARYDHATRTFEIHTPEESARKEWIGGAGHDARLATVFAQLDVEGEIHGVHAFLVPIRDLDGAPLPGIRLEDSGPKMGLNGVDNGRIWFDRVRVPREALLDAYASIDDDGRYQSPIASDTKRFFTMLGTLVGGRISVAGAALSASKAALTIAIRYGDRRRQFGPEGAPETLLLDYPTHRRRLLPLLAETYALHFAHEDLVARYERKTEDDERVVEALAAGLKAIATWSTTRTIQTARECCGGQGYLSVNELGDLKADTDVFTTFEGDNTVLMQLVAKALLTEFRAQFEDAKVVAVVRHLARRALTALTEKNPLATRRADVEHLRGEAFHRAALTFREESLLASAAARLRKRIGAGLEPTVAFVEVQTHLVALARAHVERVVFDAAAAKVRDAGLPVLGRLLDLYALSRIEADLAWFLENGYIEPTKARAIRKEVDTLCDELRPDAVALVDAFRIPTKAPIAV
jgi:acyl-CoA oxidase